MIPSACLANGFFKVAVTPAKSNATTFTPLLFSELLPYLALEVSFTSATPLANLKLEDWLIVSVSNVTVDTLSFLAALTELVSSVTFFTKSFNKTSDATLLSLASARYTFTSDLSTS